MTETESGSPRILIVRLSALGDIFHALPLLKQLREHWPEAFIGWLVEPVGAKLIYDHPLLNRLHIVPKREWKQDKLKAWRGPFRALREEIRAQRYTIAIDAQGLTKSAFWPRWCGIPMRIGFEGPQAREISSLLYNRPVRPRPEKLHVIEQNLELLRGLNIDPGKYPIRTIVQYEPAAEAFAQRFLGNSARPLVLMNPGAGWATKRWPPERYGQLGERLVNDYGARVVLCWGPGEEGLVEIAMMASGDAWRPEVEGPIPDEPGVYHLPPSTLQQLLSVIRRAKLFVGGDSGPTHFAAGCGIDTICMMGPLDARRNGAFGAHTHTIQHCTPRKAPFFVNHRKWCDPRTRMEEITVAETCDACVQMLGPPPGR
jgi:lipopolysaccharide heptosyltransferase I